MYYNPGEPCKHNAEVRCTEPHKCARCGWNPKVSEARAEAIEEKLKKQRRAAHG